MPTTSSRELFHTLCAGRSPVQYTKSNWNGNEAIENGRSDAKNKALGLAGQTETLIGHLYNFDTIMGKLLGGHCRKLHRKWPVASCYFELWVRE